MKFESEVCTLLPPLFQPLRLWTRRVPPAPVKNAGKMVETATDRKNVPLRTFSMRGGFVNAADGERRMVIAGKLFRTQE